ncbi:MAG: flavodoxin domain-containing protein [Rhodanobacter sp.]
MGLFNARWFNRDNSGTSAWRVIDDSELLPEARLAASLPLQVIYASETGVTEQLALDTVRRLQESGVSVRLLRFDALDMSMLAVAEQVLFLVSTCCDGDPPEMADGFHRKYMREPSRLPGLRYGLLAVGDSSYDDFCAFGRQLHQWLQASGAHTLFEPVRMDNEDDAAATQWFDCIDSLVQSHAAPIA